MFFGPKDPCLRFSKTLHYIDKFYLRSRCMQNATHLHFLLALGHKKVVVLKQQEQIAIYSDDNPSHRYQNRLSMERLAEAVGAR